MARQRQVSKEIKGTVNQVLTFNLTTNALETVTIASKNTKQSDITKEIEKNLRNSCERKFLKITSTQEVSEYRAMTEETFFIFSHPEKDFDKSVPFISRTIKSAVVNYIFFDLTKNEVINSYTTVFGTDEKEEMERQAERYSNQYEKGRFLKVTDIQYKEELRFMSDAEFIKHSVKVQKGQSRIS